MRSNVVTAILAIVAFSVAWSASARAQLACDPGDSALDLKAVLIEQKKNPCAKLGTSLLGDLENRILFICEGGQATKALPFSHGAAWYPKKSEGDQKTPVGTYELGKPRESGAGFGTFIPIGYPTVEQKAAGYTGHSIGLHGPPRKYACDGYDNVVDNWTDGCVALASDEAVSIVAKFLSKHPDAKIHLVAEPAQ